VGGAGVEEGGVCGAGRNRMVGGGGGTSGGVWLVEHLGRGHVVRGGVGHGEKK